MRTDPPWRSMEATTTTTMTTRSSRRIPRRGQSAAGSRAAATERRRRRRRKDLVSVPNAGRRNSRRPALTCTLSNVIHVTPLIILVLSRNHRWSLDPPRLLCEVPGGVQLLVLGAQREKIVPGIRQEVGPLTGLPSLPVAALVPVQTLTVLEVVHLARLGRHAGAVALLEPEGLVGLLLLFPLLLQPPVLFLDHSLGDVRPVPVAVLERPGVGPEPGVRRGKVPELLAGELVEGHGEFGEPVLLHRIRRQTAPGENRVTLLTAVLRIERLRSPVPGLRGDVHLPDGAAGHGRELRAILVANLPGHLAALLPLGRPVELERSRLARGVRDDALRAHHVDPEVTGDDVVHVHRRLFPREPLAGVGESHVQAPVDQKFDVRAPKLGYTRQLAAHLEPRTPRRRALHVPHAHRREIFHLFHERAHPPVRARPVVRLTQRRREGLLLSPVPTAKRGYAKRDEPGHSIDPPRVQGVVQQVNVLQILHRPLDDGQRLVDGGGEGDLGQILADGVPQDGKEREALVHGLRRGETRPWRPRRVLVVIVRQRRRLFVLALVVVVGR
mmetsp:Transcript_13011/g.58707  ORF Transcript_13011/g.58707 Transcript_13011/m.58707 type:complete len:556 (+) Transcript_13011:155-1822(+)